MVKQKLSTYLKTRSKISRKKLEEYYEYTSKLEAGAEIDFTKDFEATIPRLEEYRPNYFSLPELIEERQLERLSPVSEEPTSINTSERKPKVEEPTPSTSTVRTPRPTTIPFGAESGTSESTSPTEGIIARLTEVRSQLTPLDLLWDDEDSRDIYQDSATDFAMSGGHLSAGRSEQSLHQSNDEVARIETEWSRAIIKINELVIKPEVFNGTKPRPREWWDSYTDAILANGWSEIVAVKYFSTFLAGPARDWWSTTIKPRTLNRSLTRVHELGQLFKENFLGEADYRNLCRYLAEKRQKPNEGVSTFIPTVVRMLNQIDPTMSERERVRQITEKLRPEYQMDLARFDSSTVEKLRNICLKVEAGLAAERVIKPTSYPRPSTSGPRDNDPSRPRRRTNGHRQTSSPKTGDPQQFIRQASFSKGARSGGKPRNFSARPRSQANVRTDGKTCSRCGRNNHQASNCFATRKLDGTFLKSNDKTRKVNAVQEEEESDQIVVRKCNAIRSSTLGKGEKPKARKVGLVNNKPHELMTTPIQCNDVTLQGTIDTGSQATIVDEEVALRHGWKYIKSTHALTAAGGNPLITPGTLAVKFELQLGKTIKEKKHMIAVARNLDLELIIGLDLLRDFQICVDTANRRISFAKNSIAPGIRMTTDTIVPPRSQTFIKGKVNAIGSIVLNPFHSGVGVLIANGIAEVINNETDILVCNPSDEPVVLEAEKQVAGFESLASQPQTPVRANIVHKLTNQDQVTISDDLTIEQQQQLIALLEKNKNAFSLNGKIGNTMLAEHKIELLPDAKPHAEPLRRRALIDIDETRKQVAELLKKDLIEESNSPWASAYVLAKKKNGTKRLCIDFRKLNDATKKIVYPLPNIEHCLDTLSGKQFFSTLDMASGFWQIPVEKHSRELTAFRTEDGLFQFKRMPFGLTNAPASFQRMVNALFAGLKGLNLQVFIDDICIATETWEEHLQLLNRVFEKVISANLTLKGDKCLFAARKIIFLGHEISAEGIRQDPEKLKALLKLEPPTDAPGIRRFLGMSGYYRKFVTNFAKLSEPLTRLTRKNVDFNWGNEQEQSFKSIIAALAANATLAHFNHSDPLMLKTDASYQGVAGILLQQQKGDWKMVTCCSRRLSSSENNYGITDLEGLAIVYCCQKLRPYLLGKRFEIICDHSALLVLNSKNPNSARLRRWALILSEYNYEIKYTKGSLHEDVDCLSRAPINDENDDYLDAKVYTIYQPANAAEWIGHYTDEESISVLDDARNNRNDYRLMDEVIYKNNRLYVPQPKRAEIIKRAHENSAHGGVRVVLQKLHQFYWPNMVPTVENIVRACHTCQLRKADRSRQAGDMFHHESFAPLELVAIDAWHTNKASRNNNRVVITAIDCFTKYIVAEALPNLNGAVATKFMNDFLGHFGAPRAVLTDNANEFVSVAFKELLAAHRIIHRTSTPGHSQGNATIERAIQTLQDRLSSATLNTPHAADWDQLLPTIVLGINTSYHSATKYTPYELMFGREASLRIDGLSDSNDPKDMYAKLIKQHLDDVHRNARLNVSTAQLNSEARYLANRRPVEFAPGTKVLARNAGKRDDTKTGERYQGPFEVISNDKDIYELRHCQTNKRYQRHASSLKPYRLAVMGILSVIACLTLTTLGISFDEEPFVLYQGTEHAVEEQRISVDLSIGFLNPCDLVDVHNVDLQFEPIVRKDNPLCDEWGCYDHVYNPNNQKEVVKTTMNNIHEKGLFVGLKENSPAFAKDLLYELEEIKTKCEREFKTILTLVDDYEFKQANTKDVIEAKKRRYVPATTSLSALVPSITMDATLEQPTEKRSIQRRVTRFFKPLVWSIISTVGAEVSTVVGLIVATDLIRLTWRFFSTSSTESRLNKIEDTLTFEMKKRDYVLLHAIDNGLHDIMYSMALLQTKVNNNQKVTALRTELRHATQVAEEALQALIISKGENLLNPGALYKLIKMQELLTLNSHMELQTVQVRRTPNRTTLLNIRFNMHRISSDTVLANMISISHWDIVSPGKPKLLENPDTPYIVFNISAHCVKQVQRPLKKIVYDYCRQPNHIDPKLTVWHTSIEADDPRKVPAVITEYHSNTHSYIYCFPKTIKIYGENITCPNKVIKVPVLDTYQVQDGEAWTPLQLKQTTTKFLPKDVLDTISSKHHSFGADFNTQTSLDALYIEAKNNISRYENKERELYDFHRKILKIAAFIPAVIVSLGTICFLCSLCYKYSVIRRIIQLFCTEEAARQLQEGLQTRPPSPLRFGSPTPSQVGSPISDQRDSGDESEPAPAYTGPRMLTDRSSLPSQRTPSPAPNQLRVGRGSIRRHRRTQSRLSNLSAFLSSQQPTPSRGGSYNSLNRPATREAIEMNDL